MFHFGLNNSMLQRVMGAYVVAVMLLGLISSLLA